MGSERKQIRSQGKEKISREEQETSRGGEKSRGRSRADSECSERWEKTYQRGEENDIGSGRKQIRNQGKENSRRWKQAESKGIEK